MKFFNWFKKKQVEKPREPSEYGRQIIRDIYTIDLDQWEHNPEDRSIFIHPTKKYRFVEGYYGVCTIPENILTDDDRYLVKVALGMRREEQQKKKEESEKEKIRKQILSK